MLSHILLRWKVQYMCTNVNVCVCACVCVWRGWIKLSTAELKRKNERKQRREGTTQSSLRCTNETRVCVCWSDQNWPDQSLQAETYQWGTVSTSVTSLWTFLPETETSHEHQILHKQPRSAKANEKLNKLNKTKASMWPASNDSEM